MQTKRDTANHEPTPWDQERNRSILVGEQPRALPIMVGTESLPYQVGELLCVAPGRRELSTHVFLAL